MNKKGVSIAELLAVVVVMGIIASIALPLVGGVIDNVRKKAFIQDVFAIKEASRIYCQVNLTNDFCDNKQAESLLGAYESGINTYVTDKFSNYKMATVLYDENYLVLLKNKEYETRNVLLDDNNYLTYKLDKIKVEGEIDNYIIKNKA